MSSTPSLAPAPSFAARFPLFMRAAYVAIWFAGIQLTVRLVLYAASPATIGEDAHAYWLTGQAGDLYGPPPGADDAFLYSPAFAQAIRPLTLLPWPAFLAVWIALELAAVRWLLRVLPRRWAVPALLLCLPELFGGNIYLLLAAVSVLGLRRPELWAFPVLTKIGPCVGLVWFAVRAEWGRLLVAAATTLGVAAVSLAMDPGAWRAWLSFLVSNHAAASDGTVGVAVRCLVALALVVLGARRDQPWTLAVAMLLACPIIWNAQAVSLLVALPRLVLLGPARSALSDDDPDPHRGSVGLTGFETATPQPSGTSPFLTYGSVASRSRRIRSTADAGRTRMSSRVTRQLL